MCFCPGFLGPCLTRGLGSSRRRLGLRMFRRSPVAAWKTYWSSRSKVARPWFQPFSAWTPFPTTSGKASSCAPSPPPARGSSARPPPSTRWPTAAGRPRRWPWRRRRRPRSCWPRRKRRAGTSRGCATTGWWGSWVRMCRRDGWSTRLCKTRFSPSPKRSPSLGPALLFSTKRAPKPSPPSYTKQQRPSTWRRSVKMGPASNASVGITGPPERRASAPRLGDPRGAGCPCRRQRFQLLCR
mmetsp:Transcript_15068/g.36364  ORF Transcript_15068/g.36364 Transcript_15068/m.36364 type:complete len:240 (-) Transcript_15068:156-875(-)